MDNATTWDLGEFSGHRMVLPKPVPLRACIGKYRVQLYRVVDPQAWLAQPIGAPLEPHCPAGVPVSLPRSLFESSFSPIGDVATGANGLYARRRKAVPGVRLDRPCYVERRETTGDGTPIYDYGSPGDYLVRADDGMNRIVDSKLWRTAYVEADFDMNRLIGSSQPAVGQNPEPGF